MRENQEVKKRQPKSESNGVEADGHARRQATRRAEILAAAKEVFFRKGYARASMDDIVQAVGGSKRTLYRHFPAKEDLYAEIIRDVAKRILPDSSTEFTLDLVADMRILGRRYLSALLLPETLELFRGVIAEVPHLPGLANIFFENGPGRLVESVQQRFEMANRSGMWKVPHSRTTAQHFVGMLRASVHESALIYGRTVASAEINRCVEDAIKTLLHGAVFVHKSGK